MNTPGPWKKGRRNQVVSDSAEGLEEIDGAIDEAAVEYYGGNLIAESIASCNIPLIVMAPELRVFVEEVIESDGIGDFDMAVVYARRLQSKLERLELEATTD